MLNGLSSQWSQSKTLEMNYQALMGRRTLQASVVCPNLYFPFIFFGGTSFCALFSFFGDIL